MNTKSQKKKNHLQINTPKNEIKPLIEIRKMELSNPRPVTASDIRTALDTLIAFMAADVPGRIPVTAGDIFVCYNIKLACAEEPVYELTGQVQMKEVLTETGIAAAPEVVEMQLLDLIRPLKNKAMTWINKKLQELQEDNY
jgi:hypothetical protein